MAPRVGINGFGRVGRLALRAAWDRPGLTFAHVNELHGDAATAAHLLMFDSVHGRWAESADGEGTALEVAGRPLGYGSLPTPGEVPWADAGVEIVLECSGKFRTAESLRPYFEGGVRKVIVVAPVKDRAAGLSLIPTTTGSATAIGLIFPQLQGRLNGLAVRVPMLNASLTDCVFEVERATDVEEVNETQVKLPAWYDNEWGYANRLVDLALAAASSLED